MTQQEVLIEEIKIQFSYLKETVNEVIEILAAVGDNKPTNHDKAASAQYVSQFYNGIENILKRIVKFYNFPLPKSEDWHTQLLKYFDKEHNDCQIPLFNPEHIDILNSFRKTRHVIRQGYHFNLDWERFVIVLQNIPLFFKIYDSIIRKKFNISD